jgi:hypothetical protein
MIRPITVLTFLMACGSGLYLYSEKHDVQVLDRTIEKTVQQTDALRDQSRVLATEWTTLNAPERLRDYADKYLTLKSIQPTQFTSLADLDKRLPAIETPPPAEDGQPLASTTDSDADAAMPSVASTEGLPSPPVPPGPSVPPGLPTPSPAAVASVEPTHNTPVATPPMSSRQAVASVESPHATQAAEPSAVPQQAVASAESPRALARMGAGVPTVATGIAPAVSQPPLQAMGKTPDRRPAMAARTPDMHVNEPKLADARPSEPAWAERQPVAPRPVRPIQNPPMQAAANRPDPYRAPVSAQPMPVAAPYGGSLLGMARSAPPAPRPTPVNATNWYNAN